MSRLLAVAVVFAAEGGAPAGGQGGGNGGGIFEVLFQLAPLILIGVALIWFMNRSQKKREQERQEMLDSIRPKDDVMTIGGIRGRVVRMEDDEVVLRIDPDKDVKVTMAKTGIARKVGEEEQSQ